MSPLIVVPDAVFLPPECRRRLEKLGEVRVYEGRPDSLEAFLARIRGADVAIVTHFRLPAAVFEDAGLKLVALARTGYDDVDIEAAAQRGVAVANAPGYSDEAVAEHVFALLLSFIRRVKEADQSVRDGRFECSALEGRELAQKALGLIGTGRIGLRVAEIARCFGMDVIAYDARPSPRAMAMNVRYVGLSELCQESDFISVHVPLTPETEGLIGREALGQMKRTAVLVNTARGRIVDEGALAWALERRAIAGACLDVFSDEPLPVDSPLARLDNVLLTPHIAYNTEEAKRRCMAIAVANVEAFMAGRPANIVNAGALPCGPAGR